MNLIEEFIDMAIKSLQNNETEQQFRHKLYTSQILKKLDDVEPKIWTPLAGVNKGDIK